MVAGFVGRVAELTALDSLLEESADAGTVMISVIGGTAGVGKTSLAVHWAHTVAGRFPDGQLYVDLRGFDPSGSPMTSAEAVRGFLDAFEVPPERVPVSLDAQAALYRSLLAGRRVLVVTDNARDAEQVRPLLPGSPGCVVVVTSRNRLTSLISAEGARPLTLDLLTCEEAGQLLSRRIGASRVAAEPQAAEKIIALCTRLPLALSIVAARAAAHPRFSLETLAAELSDAPCAPLGALDRGDRVTDMRAVFHWSYRQLSASAARLFRLLGLHRGPDITAPAAASLAGLPQQAVRPLLTELTLAHMVTEHIAGRFALHDLLRAHAAEHANSRNADDERQAAVRRMLDHYLHSAYNAAIRLHPRAGPITLAPPVPGIMPQQLADDTAALAWFEAEYPVLLRTIKLSADTAQTVHAWQLPWTLTEFLARRGHWHDWAAAQDTALAAAQHGADRHGQAHSHRGLGQAWYRLGRYDQARKHFQQAIRLFQELSDQAGQADTHLALGWMLGYQGRPEEALRHAQQALSLTRATGSRHGQARALLSVGWDHALLGEYEQAISCCQQALALFRQFGDRRSESRTLDGLGYAHHHLGCHQQAIAYYRQALALYRELGDRHGQAITLNHLGDTHHATADLDAAGEAWQQASGILEQLGAVVTETPTHAPLHPA